jgi:hypothetical protein
MEWLLHYGVSEPRALGMLGTFKEDGLISVRSIRGLSAGAFITRMNGAEKFIVLGIFTTDSVARLYEQELVSHNCPLISNL